MTQGKIGDDHPANADSAMSRGGNGERTVVVPHHRGTVCFADLRCVRRSTTTFGEYDDVRLVVSNEVVPYMQ